MAGANDRWEFYRDSRNKWRWRRVAVNGRIVASASQGFASRADCEANARRSGYGTTSYTANRH